LFTGGLSCLAMIRVYTAPLQQNRPIDYFSASGIAGGIVQSTYFQIRFGVRPAEGPAEQSRIDNVSANVVSVLQGGAFFGAISSAPVSGGYCWSWSGLIPPRKYSS
jgi:hypothetical protein